MSSTIQDTLSLWLGCLADRFERFESPQTVREALAEVGWRTEGNGFAGEVRSFGIATALRASASELSNEEMNFVRMAEIIRTIVGAVVRIRGRVSAFPASSSLFWTDTLPEVCLLALQDAMEIWPSASAVLRAIGVFRWSRFSPPPGDPRAPYDAIAFDVGWMADLSNPGAAFRRAFRWPQQEWDSERLIGVVSDVFNAFGVAAIVDRSVNATRLSIDWTYPPHGGIEGSSDSVGASAFFEAVRRDFAGRSAGTFIFGVLSEVNFLLAEGVRCRISGVGVSVQVAPSGAIFVSGPADARVTLNWLPTGPGANTARYRECIVSVNTGNTADGLDVEISLVVRALRFAIPLPAWIASILSNAGAVLHADVGVAWSLRKGISIADGTGLRVDLEGGSVTGSVLQWRGGWIAASVVERSLCMRLGA